MQNTSAVKFGDGPGWPATHLFVVGFDGVVRELTPPAGQDPVPPGRSQQEQPPAGPPPAPPAMSLNARPRSIRAGRRSCVHFIARAEGRRVREATIRFAGRHKDTDSRGQAVLCAHPRRPGRLIAAAAKPGIKRATTVVRVTRPG
jgi:hypothetical protein